MKTPINMKNTTLIFTIALFMAACNDGTDLDAKKAEVNDLKAEALALNKKISDLENEIKKEDPEYGKKSINAVLVTTKNVTPEYFEHKVEVRGSVNSRTNVTVSAEIPGKIQTVNVSEGDFVKKGDLLFTQDSEIISNNIAELEKSLELATVVARKQDNLYKQNVGTEIQYLQAKNNQESLERRLATAKSQMRQARVRAPFNGSVDRVDAKVGEMAQPGNPMVRIVNPNDVHISSDVSERFIGKFKKGDQVDIYFPTQDQKLSSTVSSVGQVINAENRTFEMEINLPKLNFAIRPNQVVVLNLTDYSNDQALKIPTKLILRDKQGQYIYGLKKDKDMNVATKVYVETGISYNNETEIKSGLMHNQLIALKGYRDLVEGVAVQIVNEEKSGTAGTSANAVSN
ncbi:MAG: efflux RND transporter periplasmic adaptor subunit [Reichenbachiella sp.]